MYIEISNISTGERVVWNESKIKKAEGGSVEYSFASNVFQLTSI